MLQQTQVATVRGYFERFIEALPTVRALAGAPIDEVKRLWSGLGYYRRADQLHAAAKMMVDRHGGEVPRGFDELMELPGVGRYTAGAIASIAFEEARAAVDGNVERVFARVFHRVAGSKRAQGRGCEKRTVDSKRAWEIAEWLVPRKRPGDFNQALMELGATVCVPGRPKCDECPVNRMCGARNAGVQDSTPAARRAAGVKNERIVAVVVRDAGEVLMKRRPLGGMWSGLWDVPNRVLCDDEKPEVVAAQMLREVKLGRVEAKYKDTIRARLTHRAICVDVFAGDYTRRAGGWRVRKGFRWVAKDGAEIGISQLTRRILAL